jgi:uncharacterized membrane protein YhfC
MDLLFITHFLNSLLMLLLPLGLAAYFTRRWKLGWRLWLIGGATFIMSQVGHIPFNAVMTSILNQTGLKDLTPQQGLLFNAVFLGLSAGLFEELFRYGMFRWWAKDARSWRTSILAGAGHGGVEAIFVGALALYGFFQLAALRSADLSTLFPANQLALAQQQVAAYWSMPWTESFLGLLERCLTIPIQISFSVIVLQAFTRRQFRWVVFAILYHAVIDAAAVLAVSNIGPYWTEALVALFTLLSIFIILRLHQPEPVQPVHTVVSTPLPVITPKEIQANPDNLDDSRFS